jgi:hypothetical protein
VVIPGTLRFIAFDLLGRHVTGADGADEPPSADRPDGEGDKERPAFPGPAHGDQPVLLLRVCRVRRYAGAAHEKRLDLGYGNAMLPAMRPVARIPIKPEKRVVAHSAILHFCIYIPTFKSLRRASSVEISDIAFPPPPV